MPTHPETPVVQHTCWPPEPDPQRPLALVLHGVFGARRNWRAFARQLSEAMPQWQFATVDLRNHGDSQGLAGPHDLAATADDLAHLGARLGRLPQAVIGHSFGGKVAMEYLRRHPRHLQKVWVLDTPLGPGRRPGAPESDSEVSRVISVLQGLPQPLRDRRALVAALRREGFSDALATWMGTNLRPAPTGGVRFHFDLENITEMLESYWATDFHGFLDRDPGAEVEIVVAGRSDRWTETELDGLGHLARHPWLRMHRLEGAGHWLHVDDPEGLLALLVAHFDAEAGLTA